LLFTAAVEKKEDVVEAAAVATEAAAEVRYNF
jgi:hypothetical protein